PLFVVVVAVDPRWLLRSLTVHYHELFDAARPAGASRDSSWESTPMQYLEKIFQIPFTLQPVDQAGYTTMIEALTASAPDTARSQPRSARAFTSTIRPARTSPSSSRSARAPTSAATHGSSVRSTQGTSPTAGTATFSVPTSPRRGRTAG